MLFPRCNWPPDSRFSIRMWKAMGESANHLSHMWSMSHGIEVSKVEVLTLQKRWLKTIFWTLLRLLQVDSPVFGWLKSSPIAVKQSPWKQAETWFTTWGFDLNLTNDLGFACRPTSAKQQLGGSTPEEVINFYDPHELHW